jgi:5-methylcytosine-specific restriction endonuclease McrA
MAERTCPHCGRRFEQTGRGAPRQWCYECLPAYDADDKVAYTRRAAALQYFKNSGSHSTCCGVPKERHPTPWRSTKLYGPLRLCCVCREVQVPTMQARVCTSPECRRVHHNTSKVQWQRDTEKGKAWKKRHARNRRRTTRIGNRDGWVCHLCRKRVDKRLPWPDPMCATVDHLIPRSCGGSDEAVNLALAHFKCNMDKSDRAVGEQLRLVG